MKTSNYLFVLVMLSAFIGTSADGCIELKHQPGPYEKEHSLRRMINTSSTQTVSSGNYFLVYGEYGTESQVLKNIQFAWMMDSTYAISSLPIEKIQVRFNKNLSVPTIKFVLESNTEIVNYSDDTQGVMSRDVAYAIITVREEDWPSQIQLPMSDTTQVK